MKNRGERTSIPEEGLGGRDGAIIPISPRISDVFVP